MTEDQQKYIDLINSTPDDEILLKHSGWEVIDMPTHFHGKHQLIHTLSGTLRIKVKDANYFVPEHHLAWIPAGMAHQLSSNNRQITLQIICCAGLSCIKEELMVYNTNTFIGENLKFIGDSGNLIKKADMPEKYSFVVGFLNLLAVIGEEYKMPLRGLFEPHDKRLVEILRYIDLHFAEPLTKESIADRFGMSSRNLSRLFRNADIRFAGYLNYQRITRAIELFADHDLTIEQVAYEVGYNSPNHFNRVFRQLLGHAPGYYYKR